ncbi:Iron-sulfur cluster assembly protein SufD [hydrothermal vent metagenome]|uniref:Iron-sulfur cluster assembly protein SufD n=1 Tax=hydrothermal vent metagenome TaxID=652676 RepID=A0A3B0VUU4_9ZZZZ
MVGLITDWLEQAQIQKNTNPSWLQAKRQTALLQMQGLNAPNRKLESWRYTDANRLTKKLSDFESSSHCEQQTTAEAVAPIVIVVDESGYMGLAECPDWLMIQPLADMRAEDWHDCVFDQESVINLANSLLLQTGGLISIKATDQPVHIQLVYAFDEANAWQYVRNQFDVAAGVNVSITEQHQSGRVNAVNIFNLGDGVELNRKQNICLNSSEQFVSFNQFEVSAGANVSSVNHHIGGSLQHHNHTVNFNAEGSKYKSGSINKSFDNNHITDIVNVNHHCKGNQSDVTHRSIAKHQSQIYNNAKALVAVGADQSEIGQDLKNILLSPDAKIFSKPELEIYADEVIAAHGSTIGALDDAALFYLQSRGVDIEQAREIMIESFEQEALI